MHERTVYWDWLVYFSLEGGREEEGVARLVATLGLRNVGTRYAPFL